MNFGKIVFWVVIVIIAGIVGLKIKSHFSDDSSSSVKVVEIQPYTQPDAKSPTPEPVKDQGWKLTGSTSTPNGMTQFWFTPDNKKGSTTWFPLKQGGRNHNYGYRVQQDTKIQFKTKDGKVTTVKIDGKTFLCYKEISDGKFSDEVLQESEFLPIRKDAEEISFHPIQEPMVIRVWRAL
jgi:hypothetical protein